MLQAKSPLNLSSGLAFSESAELFDELGPVFLKTRSQMATGERKQGQGREKIADSEEVKPRTEVFNAPSSFQHRRHRCHKRRHVL